MGAWVHGCMGAWVHGCMGAWVHGRGQATRLCLVPHIRLLLQKFVLATALMTRVVKRHHSGSRAFADAAVAKEQVGGSCLSRCTSYPPLKQPLTAGCPLLATCAANVEGCVWMCGWAACVWDGGGGGKGSVLAA